MPILDPFGCFFILFLYLPEHCAILSVLSIPVAHFPTFQLDIQLLGYVELFLIYVLSTSVDCLVNVHGVIVQQILFEQMGDWLSAHTMDLIA